LLRAQVGVVFFSNWQTGFSVTLLLNGFGPFGPHFSCGSRFTGGLPEYVGPNWGNSSRFKILPTPTERGLFEFRKSNQSTFWPDPRTFFPRNSCGKRTCKSSSELGAKDESPDWRFQAKTRWIARGTRKRNERFLIGAGGENLDLGKNQIPDWGKCASFAVRRSLGSRFLAKRSQSSFFDLKKPLGKKIRNPRQFFFPLGVRPIATLSIHEIRQMGQPLPTSNFHLEQFFDYSSVPKTISAW